MNINDDILYKIDSEIGKDKKVVELQREIERLNQEIRGLNNCIIEFHSEFCNKQAEINRLNNIINELEKVLDENVELTYVRYGKRQYNKTLTEGGLLFRDYIKSKLQELKGDESNEKI